MAPRIFVSIASYRDTECQWPVKSLFERARPPERVFAGTCWFRIPWPFTRSGEPATVD